MRHRNTAKVFLFSVLFSSLVVSVGHANQAVISDLMNTKSYHDGPNCFNTALVAKGFKDKLVQTHRAEFWYLMSTYCKLNVGGEVRPGDVLVTKRLDYSRHAGVAMENGMVFQKDSIAGLSGANPYSPYEVLNFKDSRFDASVCDEWCRLRVFTCPSFEEVKVLAQRCTTKFDQLGLSDLESALEAVVRQPNKQYVLSQDDFSKVRTVVSRLKSLTGRETCDLHAYAVAVSLSYQLDTLNQESPFSTAWDEELRSFNRVLFSLEARMKGDGSDPIANQVIRESD